MKVKSFVVGTANGMDSSMARLDENVAGLGGIDIHSVTDTVVPARIDVKNGTEMTREWVIRVIVYTPIT